MHRTKMFLSHWKWVVAVAGMLLLFALVLVGCGGEPTAVGEATLTKVPDPEPTEVSAQPATPASMPTELPAVTPTSQSTPTERPTQPPATATAIPTPEPIDDSGCITCHTSQETLQALAIEEEKPEVESEGEG